MGGQVNEQINVNLTLESQGGTNGWHMNIAGQGKGGPNNYPKAVVKHGSNADFHFAITGPGTQNITFADINPISIAPDTGTGSPTVIGNNSDQIVNISVGGKKVLSFTDLNTDPPAKLTYQLNFSDGSKLDPIIENGGGGPPGFQFEYYLIGGVLLFALLALVAFRNKWAKSRTVNTPAANPPANKPPIVEEEND
jgi:hypothetical protein